MAEVKRPALPEPEVWTRKGTRRALAHAIARERAGAEDDELRALAAVGINKVAADLMRALLGRSLEPVLWALYAEALARRFGR